MNFRVLGLGLVCLAFSQAGFAASCGTVASPTACGITVGGTNTFDITSFALPSSSASGGGNAYSGDDIAIDLSSAGGLSIVVTFSKLENSPTPGLVFFANAGQGSAFTISYTVNLSAAVPGTASFAAPSTVSIPLSSAVGNGFSATQMILSDGVNGVSCVALRNSINLTQGDCNSLPANTTSFLNVGNITNLTGGTGNTSVGGIRNLFNSDFAPGSSQVPEPSTYAMMALGLGALAILRRK